MSKTNCVNCGHGKDPDEIKCPFCGTTYLDFTSVDMDGHTPCILSIKLPGTDNVFQMKAIPTVSCLTIEPEVVTVDMFHGQRPRNFIMDNHVTCEIKFEGVH